MKDAADNWCFDCMENFKQADTFGGCSKLKEIDTVECGVVDLITVVEVVELVRDGTKTERGNAKLAKHGAGV